jgi:hypothetical protein
MMEVWMVIGLVLLILGMTLIISREDARVERATHLTPLKKSFLRLVAQLSVFGGLLLAVDVVIIAAFLIKPKPAKEQLIDAMFLAATAPISTSLIWLRNHLFRRWNVSRPNAAPVPPPDAK